MVSIPVFEQDLYSDEFIQNPYPGYTAMRELGAVVWLPTLGNFALTRHSEVQAALRDHQTFISSDGVAADQFGCDFLQGNTVASDGQKHTELRQAMAPPMLPGELVSIAPAVQSAADQLIDDLLQRKTFDAITDLAQHLPLTVVRDMVGLPDFGQQKMLQWAAAAFDVLGVQNERGREALSTIAEMRDFIQQDATRENLKPGSWTRRIHELVDQGLLPCEHAPFAIRDYINPSLDTTISATGELILQLAQNPGQWQKLKQHPKLINNAVNEAIRLATPIRSFTRHTSTDVDINGHTIPRGSRVMMLFASANRDERAFKNPDNFDITRNPRTHVGFGSGVHMCVGMHLAQLEMEALLHGMLSRVGSIEVGTPTIKLNNTIRAYAKLPCSFVGETRIPILHTNGTLQQEYSQLDPDKSPALLRGRISGRRPIADNVMCFEIVPEDEEHFPTAQAGAHIDIHLPSGQVRQYSLTGNLQPDKYTIAVLRTKDSRGGSRWLHEHVHTGTLIQLSRPRNLFPLYKNNGKAHLFAGGIGLTPLLAMAWELHNSHQEFAMHIFVRSFDQLPFREDVTSWPFTQKIQVHIHNTDRTDDKRGLNIKPLLDDGCSNATIYICGPGGFMATVSDEAMAAGVPSDHIFREHFGAEINPYADPFTIIARKSGHTLQVPADKTILGVLREAGIPVETSCENGVCGSCLTGVIEGKPDHRDMVQTAAEKSSNQRIAVCCSRSQSRKLVLDC